MRLPASSGSDWFVCSNNRVYVHTGAEFSYGAWLCGLQEGRSFITNGPALFLTADGVPVGGTIPGGRSECDLSVRWAAHYPISQVELVVNGEVARQHTCSPPAASGEWSFRLPIPSGGWLAARAWGEGRDSFAQAGFAHTSPIYLEDHTPGDLRAAAAGFFLDATADSLNWVNTAGRFHNDSQRQEVRELFMRGRSFFAEAARA